ncbi:MAG: LysR family transcriptional regulator, partial [Cellulomonas sp.]|nr:LysR family transcriptional regulator [Cellulomonas sp.]
MATSPAAAPDLRALGLLVAVADAGGIGAPARSLGISQPSASDGVRALERRLGLTLVRRGRTGSELTDAGRIVVELARRVLAATSDLT